MSGPIVTVSQGQLQGKTVQTASGKEYHSFQGIPYAKPPIGSLRFKPPSRADNWRGVWDATYERGKSCQYNFATRGYDGSEDCLYLNLYSPAADAGAKLPVMFWIHGGAYVIGSGNFEDCNPENFIDRNIIVVSVNYRLNILGFMCLYTKDVPGNAGLKDQVVALEWVKSNIERFGGDPDNITLTGHSAGGASACLMTASPMTKGLFSKVISDSASSLHDILMVDDDTVAKALRISNYLGGRSDDLNYVCEFLRKAPVEDVLNAVNAIKTEAEKDDTRVMFTPKVEKTIEGVDAFVDNWPINSVVSGNFTKVPTLVGFCPLEGVLFLRRDRGGVKFFQDMELFVPVYFNLRKGSPISLEIADQIRTFYFGDDKIGPGTLKEYVDLVSDTHFIRDILRYCDHVASRQKEPVYLYRFSHDGNANRSKPVVEMLGLKGPTHADILSYTFPSDKNENEFNEADGVVRERLCDLWANFAKFGNPVPAKTDILTSEWVPYNRRNRSFLDIGEDLVSGREPAFERMNFWRDLLAKYYHNDKIAPEPAEPWDGVRPATAEGNPCPQVDILIQKGLYLGEEDCLFLNVYTPTLNSADLPVMFWVHGGGFQLGSGNTDFYGPDYLVEKDVVLVTINYRLNVLGFLCLNTPEVPGNAGLKDQALALKWVKDNAANFGGDPNNITVFGESAGGASVSHLSLSPLTKDSISKAILQSGNALSSWGLNQTDPLENTLIIAKALGHEKEDVESLHEFLLTVPVEQLVKATQEKGEAISAAYIPIVEKIFPGVQAFLSEPPIDILTSGRSAKVPVMIGNTSLEGALMVHLLPGAFDTEIRKFIPKEFNVPFDSPTAHEIAKSIKEFYFGDQEIGTETVDQYMQYMGDVLFNVSGSRYVNYLRQSTTQPLFEYKFSYQGSLRAFIKPEFEVNGAMHGDDICYLFSGSLFKEVEETADDVSIRDLMLELWTNFAKFGDPTPEQNQLITEKWLPVTSSDKHYLDIDKELSLKTDQFAESVEFWNGLYNKYFQLWNENDIRNSRASLGSGREINVLSAPVVQNTSFIQSAPVVQESVFIQSSPVVQAQNGHSDQNGSINSTVNVAGKADVIRANDPPEDDLPKNIGVNKFVNFFESLGGKKD